MYSTIKNVNKYLINGLDFIYQLKNGNIIINGIRERELPLLIELNYFNNRVFIHDWEGNYYIFDNKGKSIQEGNNNAYYKINYNYIGNQYLHNGEIYESIINKDFEKEFSVNFEKFNDVVFLFKDIFVLLRSSSHIVSFTTSQNAIRWELNMSPYRTYINQYKEEKPYEVQKFLGVWNNELIIALSNSLLITIDINTGEILHEWQKLDGFYPQINEIANKMPPADNLILDANNNLLIGAYVYSFVEVNLKTNAVATLDIKEELFKYNIVSLKNTRDNPFTDTHIYLTATLTKTENDPKWSHDCIIALNRKSKKIDWFHAFEEASLGTNIPKLGENNLYQLDNEGTLHVFRKD